MALKVLHTFTDILNQGNFRDNFSDRKYDPADAPDSPA